MSALKECPETVEHATLGYVTRILPAEEWDRLTGTELAVLTPFLNPDETRVVVVEQDGVIVACWAATKMVHLEGVWIRPGHQRVARRLMKATRAAVEDLGAMVAITGTETPTVREIIERLGGQRLAVEWFVVSV